MRKDINAWNVDTLIGSVKNKFPCQCGHTLKYHVWYYTTIKSKTACGHRMDENRFYSCSCHAYKPDNLKFLEQQYEKSL